MATLNCVLRLTVQEPPLFCEIGKETYPVPNKWGMRGCTTFEIKKVERAVFVGGFAECV